MASVEAYLVEHRNRFLAELLDLLRIPSISSLPENAADVRRAAEWVTRRLAAAGLEDVCILETGGHPVVYGGWLHAADRPTILIFGHFDTQPVDPIEQWTSPLFEPTIREDRVYARGASDDKGKMLAPIFAVEALLRSTGRLPVNVKFLLEGQEEIGSPQLPTFLEQNGVRFACDLVVSADAGQWSEEQPQLSLGTKGLYGLQVDARGATSDLHSGIHGGVVQNPIHALVALLSSMRGEDGRILVEGFYDQVVPLAPEERTQVARIPFDESEYRDRLGVVELFGESGYTPLERAWSRPTLEINGIWGGFQGAGVKTVLPAEAHAKITCRLVPDQDPDAVLDAIERHISRHTAAGVTITTRRHDARVRAYHVAAEHPGNQAVADVLRATYGRKPLHVRSGGTLPVSDLFLRYLDANLVGFGFALDDEDFHAPNEFFRLASFERAQKAYCDLLVRLGEGLT